MDKPVKRLRYTKKLHGFAIESVLPLVDAWKARRAMIKPWKVTRYDRRNPLVVPSLA